MVQLIFTQPKVEVTDSVLPAGAATEAKLEAVRLLLAAINSKDFSTQTTLANLLAELQLKADLTETQPVSATSLPLPTGAATSANQATMITALQLIDDLRAALGSVNTDDLQVDVKTMPTVTVQAGGGDKLFSLESVIGESLSNTNLPAGITSLNSAFVPAGKIWVINFASVRCVSATINFLLFYVIHNGAEFWLLSPLTPVSNTLYTWNGAIVLDADDWIIGYVQGATLGDSLYFHYLGYQMDAP